MDLVFKKTSNWILAEAGYVPALPVCDGGIDQYQVHIDFDGRRGGLRRAFNACE